MPVRPVPADGLPPVPGVLVEPGSVVVVVGGFPLLPAEPAVTPVVVPGPSRLGTPRGVPLAGGSLLPDDAGGLPAGGWRT
jgi:hypothetical protein